MLRLTTRGRGWRGRAMVLAAVGVVTPVPPLGASPVSSVSSSSSSPPGSCTASPISPTTAKLGMGTWPPPSACRPLSTLSPTTPMANATRCLKNSNGNAASSMACALRPRRRIATAGLAAPAAPRMEARTAAASSLLLLRKAWPRLSGRHVRRLSDQPPKPSMPAPSTPSAPSTPAPSTPAPTSSAPSTPARENIYTVPNFLTVGRLAAAPVIGYSIVHDQPGLALGLLVAAGFTDLLDGWIARRWRLRTVVGSIIDPLADKVLMTVLTVSLAAQGSLPVWLAVLVLGRDVGLAISAMYYRWISLPPPKTFVRYWDFSLPSAEVRPTTISKYNTFLQLALMAATTAAPVLAGASGEAATALLGGPWDLGPFLVGLQYVVAVTTVWSGLSYVFSKDAVKILSKAKA